MNSEQREKAKHEIIVSNNPKEDLKQSIRRLKTEIYEYESELRTLGNTRSRSNDEDSERRRIIVKLVVKLRQQLVEIEEPLDS